MKEMDGIHRMFARWENYSPNNEASSVEEAVVENTKKWAAELLTSQNSWRPNSVPKIDIEKGDFYVHLSPNKFNERWLIYARIGDEIVKIWYTDSSSFDNGNNLWVFHWNRWTLFQWVKEIFYAGTQEEVDEIFREWLRKKLAEKYPDDYSYEEKEETHVSTTSNGIPYKISSWTSIKNRYLEAEIWGKKYVFSPYGFLQKWKNFSVWITPKSWKDNKTTFQLKKQTEISAKNLQEAIEKMLRKIESLMKSSNKSKQGIISCINEYIV